MQRSRCQPICKNYRCCSSAGMLRSHRIDLLFDCARLGIHNRTNSAELVGKSAVYLGEPERASFASYLIRVRCCGLLPELLSGYINSTYGREWVASVVSQQVGQANVNGTKLRRLGMAVMSQGEQHEIARRVNAAFAWIDRLCSEATSARKMLDHLDQAVLAKAFRGASIRKPARRGVDPTTPICRSFASIFAISSPSPYRLILATIGRHFGPI